MSTAQATANAFAREFFAQESRKQTAKNRAAHSAHTRQMIAQGLTRSAKLIVGAALFTVVVSVFAVVVL